MEKLYTIARALDYKGGELRMDTNVDAGSVAYFLIESGNIAGVEYYDELFTIPVEEAVELVNKAQLGSDLYAGGDGTVFEVYEHVNNRLVHVSELNQFKPLMAKYVTEER